MKAPIAVIIFNRPDHAAKLRDCLRSEEFRELFVISDGPRPDKPGERERVDACREIFRDWPGTVHYNFAETNMGCKARVSSGLDWVFAHADRVIILEDDLLPLPRFFTYCDEMLEAYSDCKEIMSVCGTKVYPGDCLDMDIYFSMYANSWGWATWNRAWASYNDKFELSFTPFIAKLQKRLGSYRAAIYWYIRIRQVINGTKSSWFYCWNINCVLKEGLHIYPGSNLIVNHGFGDQSTHTAKQETYMPITYGDPLPLKIKLPKKIEIYRVADEWIEDNIYSKSLPVRIMWFLKKLHMSK